MKSAGRNLSDPTQTFRDFVAGRFLAPVCDRAVTVQRVGPVSRRRDRNDRMVNLREGVADAEFEMSAIACAYFCLEEQSAALLRADDEIKAGARVRSVVDVHDVDRWARTNVEIPRAARREPVREVEIQRHHRDVER